MATEIPSDWLRTRGTPEEFEQAELEGKAKAFNLSFDKVLLKFGSRPFADRTDTWREFVKK